MIFFGDYSTNMSALTGLGASEGKAPSTNIQAPENFQTSSSQRVAK
jgi:hypothetical protein